jgi:uncharacterized protein (TIGR03067 family)
MLDVDGDQRIIRAGDVVYTRSYCRINPCTNPPTMDIMVTQGGMRGHTLLAIYEINGDRLRVCLAATGRERPRHFDPRPGSGHTLQELERVADEKKEVGWEKLFIEVSNYSRTVNAPIKGFKPEIYQQTARYDWTGGRFEQIEITLARNPAYKERYAPEAFKDQKNPPKEVEINKKRAWLWQPKDDSSKLDRVACSLVVVLSDDKVIIFEQKGSGADLIELAKKFDLEKVEKALAEFPK